MGGCVTKRQRRVEYEVMYVKHQLVNLHLRWGTSRTKQKGLRSNWGACRFNTGPVCSCQSSSLCFLLIIKGHRPKRPWSGSLFWESFYCVKVTVSIAAGLHDQLRVEGPSRECEEDAGWAPSLSLSMIGLIFQGHHRCRRWPSGESEGASGEHWAGTKYQLLTTIQRKLAWTKIVW